MGKSIKLEKAQKEAQKSINRTNRMIEKLGKTNSNLCSSLINLQEHFDRIRNIPSEQKLIIKNIKKQRLVWKQQVDRIEKNFDSAVKKNAGGGAAGVGAGVAVAALGPTAAMGIATTFGVASTGTAISALSGAAATNAALAWLGGGALAAGGGGMAAGSTFLALAGPIGWSIAGAAILASGIAVIVAQKDKKRLENIFTMIAKRDAKTYALASTEISERIKEIMSENKLLSDALTNIESFGLDYIKMDENQQYELGTYVNLLSSATSLLINPILSLQPKLTESDYVRYLSIMHREGHPDDYLKNKAIIVYLSNLLFHIKIDRKDKELLTKSIKSNKELLKSLKCSARGFKLEYLDLAIDAVRFKYIT